MNKDKNTKTQQADTAEEDGEKLLVSKTANDDGSPSAGDQVKASRKKKIIWGIVIAVVLVGIILAIVLPIVLSKNNNDEPNNPPSRPDIQEFNPYKVDPKDVQTQTFKVSGIINLDPNPPQTKLFGDYSAQSTIDKRTQAMFGDDQKVYKPVDPQQIPSGANNKKAQKIKYEFDLLDNFQARLNMYDEEIKDQFAVKHPIFNRPPETIEARLSQMGFNQNLSPFSFEFNDVFNNEKLISTQNRKLFISEKFSEIGFTLPTKRLFGLGIHNSQFTLAPGTYSLWSRYRRTIPYDFALGGQQGNHVHPFLLAQTKNKDFLGIFLVSSSAVAFEVIHFPGYEESVVNFITLGGHLEVYFIIRGTAQEIISRYQNIVGKSQMLPYYALGVFQSSKGDPKGLQTLIKKYKDNIPTLLIEGYQIDNYYPKEQIFTVTDDATLKTVNTDLKNNKQKLLLGISAHFNADAQGFAKKSAVANQCLVKSSMKDTNGQPLKGKFADVEINYPDFINPNCGKFLSDGLTNLQSKIGDFDGIEYWGTEFFNQINGEVVPSAESEVKKPRLLFSLKEDSIGNDPTYLINQDQATSSYYTVPFLPGILSQGQIDNSTISPNATRFGNDKNKFFTEYYTHNANGHLALSQISDVIENQLFKGKRSLVFTGASWAGSGAFGGAAISSLNRTFTDLKNVISLANGLSMFGLSSIVTDVCGTQGPLNEVLCGKWMQLAAFLPVARIYGSDTYQAVDGTVKPNPQADISEFQFSTKFMMTSNIQYKLQWSRYTYTQLFRVSQEGGSIIRPLFFEYPRDDVALSNIDNSFMTGDAILVIPSLDESNAAYKGYLPKGRWVGLYNSQIIASTGALIDLTPHEAYAYAFLRPGKIVPFQLNDKSARTTADFHTLLQTSFMINPDEDEHAEGQILLDDGISQLTETNYVYYNVRYASRSINFWVAGGDQDYKIPQGYTINQLGEIKLFGDYKDVTDGCYFGRDFIPKPVKVSYNSDKQYLSIKAAVGQTLTFSEISMIKFTGPNDAPVCLSNSFSYTVSEADTATDQKHVYELSAKAPNIENLFAEVTLLDDKGTVNVTITTKSDYENTKRKFRPENVIDLTNWKTPAVKKLDSFFKGPKKGDVFGYSITNEKGDILYTANSQKLFISDYMVLDSALITTNKLTGNRIIGLGENAKPLYYENQKWNVYTKYALSQTNPVEDGKAPGKNLYGVQTLYSYQAPSTQYVGVFNLNAYAQDYIINQVDDKAEIINVLIGGLLQKFYIQAPNVDSLVQKYQQLVGYPLVPPLWSFGWQQCRYGYTNIEQYKEVYKNYTDAKIPLDVMWSDIDYMQDYKDFTYSTETYNGLVDLVKTWKTQGVKWVPIVDPGIAKRPGYFAFDQGKDQDAFIKNGQGTPITGSVWPGLTYFPDFSGSKGQSYWLQQLNNFQTLIPFDGLWIDMNEAENQCNGYCIESERPTTYIKNRVPYVPGQRDLEDKSLGLDATHQNGRKQYDMHSLYAFQEIQATHQYFKNANKQPFMISRSNFAGQGKFGGALWTGDNWQSWQFLEYSVHSLYAYSLFGIPFVGADICGFLGTEYTKIIEHLQGLCARWHQLGSLYPFSRNHNMYDTLPHEPYQFQNKIPDGSMTYSQVMINAIQLKYNLIRYYYSQFAHINQVGGTFWKPLFYEWSNDAKAYNDISFNIMLGKSIKASILTQNLKQDTTNYYFPEGKWCQIHPSISKDTCFDAPQAGLTVPLPSTIKDYQLHIRGGSIIPTQRQDKATLAKNTEDLIKQKMEFTVLSLDENKPIDTGMATQVGSAAGYIYLNDGTKLLTNDDFARFDIFFHKKDTGGCDISFFQTSKAAKRRGVEEENVRYFHILNASKTFNLNNIGQQVVTLTLNTDPVTFVTLASASLDNTQDVLTIELKDPTQSTKVFNIYDIQQISLEIPK